MPSQGAKCQHGKSAQQPGPYRRRRASWRLRYNSGPRGDYIIRNSSCAKILGEAGRQGSADVVLLRDEKVGKAWRIEPSITLLLSKHAQRHWAKKSQQALSAALANAGILSNCLTET